MRVSARFSALFVIFLTSLANCSRYALVIPNAEREVGDQSIRIPENFQTTEIKISRWLRSRNRLERSIRPSGDSAKVYFLTPWFRDYSLRFYYLEQYSRNRHLTEWTAQWTLKAIGNQESLLRVKVLELLYIGPANSSPPLPLSASKAQNSLISNPDWAETDPDKLRATLELRRFWNENYPLLPLPKQLANVSLPSLLDPPISKEWSKAKWKPLTRSKSF
jgi:hypothetical protein